MYTNTETNVLKLHLDSKSSEESIGLNQSF